MYTDYFGFREKPFSITPDPRFFYTNPSYQEAYASLLYGIRERRGFIVLTGEIGTGKTTLLRRIMENLQTDIRFVFFYNTILTFEEILDFICDELGLPTQGVGRLQKIQKLNQFLIDRLVKGETVVFMIDEAQNLREEVLENLRLLSNLETSTEKLIQIVMVGQPELEVKLNRTELRQLRQRIAIRCRLERLDDEEVGPYIYYRLNAVGCKRQQLFTLDAIQEIAYYSKGFPRLINILCDNALLIAYATSQKRITADVVQEAASDLRLEGQAGNPLIAEEARIRKSPGHARLVKAPDHGQRAGGSRWSLWLVMALLTLGIGGMGFYAWRVNASFLEESRERLGTIPRMLEGTIREWIGNPRPGESSPETQPQPRGHGQSPPFTEKIGPASAADLQAMESPAESRDSHPASEQIKVTGVSDTPGSEGQGDDQERAVVPMAEMAGWQEKPITVQPGSTVVEITTNIYGAQRNLGLDLIKEYNTHIENLNRIIAGQKLWLPPLSRETLVRRQPDGSYSLILTSFRTTKQSTQLAQIVRLKGYDVVVSPRRVSDDMLLYRVEISGLESIDAVKQAWETAVTNQWIVFTDHSLGKRFQE